MFVCPECQQLWRMKLLECGRCKSNSLRSFGTEPEDWGHPMATQFGLIGKPNMKIMNPSVVANVETIAADNTSNEPPAHRSSKQEWESWAVRTGRATDSEADQLTKAELIALASRHAVDV